MSYSTITINMIYPSDYEVKTGFDRIRSQVRDKCTTGRGRALLDEETFSSSQEEIGRRLSLCDELRTILMLERGFPTQEYTDIGHIAKKIELEGGFIDIEDMIALRNGLIAVNEVINFFTSKEANTYPSLRLLTHGVNGFPEISNHIETILDRFGKIKDNASPELYTVRRAIRDREGQISKRLQAILVKAQKDGYADADAAVSIRDGRAVIPVPAANKRKISGFIHDESATGKTFYIEPVEIVEINNELKELEYAERREIIRILTDFTDKIRPDAEGIALSGEYLATIDMIRAKARWALQNECVKPILSVDGTLEMRSARHPLLKQTLQREGKQIVPLDMKLDSAQHLLVISGPNAGGKSVCLKTVGLLQYMLQCGFLIPVSENSEFPLFKGIFIDIGDEQSIENDLSTYSSHLLNMKNMLAHADSSSLVLIDEFGSGTEPVIGGAIAESILERFVSTGTYGVITTHYSNIKYFASNHDGVANGAMMFDVQNISPLFRLQMGEPGSSFAIEIARKIGLPGYIIDAAAEKAGSDHVNLEKQLREIARDRRYWEQKRDRIRVTDRKVEELEQNYAGQLADIKRERSRILREAKLEAQNLIAETNKQIENTIRVIKESQAEKEITRFARRELDDFRDNVEKEGLSAEDQSRIEREMANVERRQQKRQERMMKQGEVTTEKIKEPEVLEIIVGSKVRIKDQDGVGEVTEVKGKKATITFGHILTTVALDRLEAISNSEFKRQTRPEKSRTVVSVDISSRKLNFRDNIDVRGMRAAEALEEVENFIDDALMVGVSEVRILHGKGTGALKEEIRRYLRGVSEVSSAKDDHPDRGGSGITIVTFKE